MKVEILSPKGYCSGVNHAISMAVSIKMENKDAQVYVLGMIVHNSFVVNELEKKGIKTVYEIDEVPSGSVLIFTAHGHEKHLEEEAKKKNIIIYDAVCPKVLFNLNLINNEINSHHQVIYIGQEGHPETMSALSLDKQVILYDKKLLFNYQLISDESPLVINQTTMNILSIQDIHKDILSHVPHARIANEICATTRNRQEALVSLENTVDMIIIVGDTMSANSKRLLEIAKMSHPDIYSTLVANVTEIDLNVAKNKNHIVISSGASTPPEIIDAIYDKLTSL